MLTLSLFRHAKSSWSDPELEDFERPLAKRGTKAVPEIAKYMRREGLVADVVLCSASVRTRATLALLIASLGTPAPEIIYSDDLYLASASAILAQIRKLPASTAHVLVVGHNPGLHALALELVGTGDRKLLAQLAQEFPTAALASFTFGWDTWANIKPASGKLEHYITPKRLAEE